MAYGAMIKQVPVPQDIPLVEEQADVVLGVVMVLDQRAFPTGQLVDDDTKIELD